MHKFNCILLTIIAYLILNTSFAITPVNNVWQPVADAICLKVKNAATLYTKKNVREARVQAIMAYFKGYDADMEPAVRVTLGGPHVFALEQKFRDYSAAMLPDVDALQIKKVNELAIALCHDLYQDAKALDAEHVKRDVLKAEQ